MSKKTLKTEYLRLSAAGLRGILRVVCCLSTAAFAQEITGFTLINADADTALQALADGDTINLADLPTQALNVRAEVADPEGATESVVFVLTGASTKTQTESVAPYAMAGDTNGNYNAFNFNPGAHTLTATPYSENGGGGTAGPPVVVTFTVVDEGGEPGPTAALLTPSAGTYGELKRWHRVTLAFEGPDTSESATPNPFLDYRLNVTFNHPGSGRTFVVPGYFAADGEAGETGAGSGRIWRIHFAPPEIGSWTYTAQFRTGPNVALSDDPAPGNPATINGDADGQIAGAFTVGETDKVLPDNRARGLLEYVEKHHLQWAGTGGYFLKQGADAPENLLAYQDFDGPFKSDGQGDGRIKTWSAHVSDWNDGDPSWQSGNGKGLIGAINYLAAEGMNACSFLTMNIAGDDRNVFPYTDYNERLRMDVSRLDQWEIVFNHADSLGMYLHFKTQETENDLLLDNGDLGTQRKLYYRELIARFSHHLALNWNLGEENDVWSERSDPDQTRVKAYAQFFYDHDPYRHNIVIHTYPNQKEQVYGPLLGDASKMTGASLQTSNSGFTQVHGDTLEWVGRSADSGRPWVVAVDEPGDAQHAIRPDDDAGNSHIDGRKRALWGTIMAGGAGNEWYFGYGHDHSDLTCQDFRSRDQWWDYCRYALQFFADNGVPFWDMSNRNDLIGNASNNIDSGFCFAKEGQVYVVYLPSGGTRDLDLTGQTGTFSVRWFDPRNGGPLQEGTVTDISGGTAVSLGNAPVQVTEDWAVLVRRARRIAYIHGDVAADGTVPSGADPAYHQMLLTDTGTLGCSRFRDMVEAEGYTIQQFYDQDTTLDEAFLAQFDVIVFGLHQKIWPVPDKAALDAWVRAGGGMLIYSDSAAGGHYGTVGAQNPVGQNVVNNLISGYGMEVCVDQANGVKAYRAGPGASHPITIGRPILEGEGVSPVAVDPNSDAVRLIPYEDNTDYKVSGTPSIPHQQGLTIQNPEFAALALAAPDDGNVIAMFDRQPMWNDGPGSDIEERDNTEILRRIINYLAGATAHEISAVIDATPTAGEAPLTVNFDGNGSFSTGGIITTYEWDFDGDGTIDDTGATTSNTYTEAGTYQAELTVTDSLAATDTATVTITVSTQTPFGNGGAPWPLPGRIEAENFDAGGEGVAYHDETAGNNGGEYRTDVSVDIQTADDDGGGFNIGWTDTGEWLEYTVDVDQKATYSLALRVASQSLGGTVRLLVDGEDKTGNIAFGSTGGWQTYSTVAGPDIPLDAGQQVLRLEIVADGFNLNWIELSRIGRTFAEFIAGYPALVGPDADPEADPDLDRIPNELEQWLAFDPTVFDPSALLVQIQDGSIHVAFSYDSTVLGSQLVYMTSTDLLNWDPVALLPEWVTQDGIMRNVAAVHDASEQRRFWTLAVEPLP